MPAAGRRHRRASRRLRHDRGAASRPAAAARATSSTSPRACARPGVFFALNHLLHFYRGQIAARRVLCGCSTRCRRSKSETARCWRRTTRWSSSWRASGSTAPARPFAMVAGSDAHTLRRVGTTWTDGARPDARRVPGAACARTGRRRPRRHARRTVAARRATASSRRTSPSLARLRAARIMPPLRRAACLAFAAASLPFQFLPLRDRGATARPRARKRSRSRRTLPRAAGAAAADVEAQASSQASSGA